jgi:hypothetical protein
MYLCARKQTTAAFSDALTPNCCALPISLHRYEEALKNGLKSFEGHDGPSPAKKKLSAQNVDAHGVLNHMKMNHSWYMKRLGKTCYIDRLSARVCHKYCFCNIEC